MEFALPCDCGYVAQGRDESELVRSARVQAHEAHRIDLTERLVLACAAGERSRSDSAEDS